MAQTIGGCRQGPETGPQFVPAPRTIEATYELFHPRYVKF